MHEGHRERIREQYRNADIDTLQDYQVLELLLTYSIPRRDTNPIAHRLMEKYGSLGRIFAADTAELMQNEGVGESTAAFLKLMGDVTRRTRLDATRDSAGAQVLTTPLASARYASALLSLQSTETVWGACLDVHGKVLHAKQIVSGDISEAPVYPRQIVEYALQQRAAAFLLMHNHPGGSPLPSQADGVSTRAVKTALESIGIRLTDHLITAEKYVYSFSKDRVIDTATGEVFSREAYGTPGSCKKHSLAVAEKE